MQLYGAQVGYEFERCENFSQTSCRGMMESRRHVSLWISVIENLCMQVVGEMDQLLKTCCAIVRT